MRKLSLLLLSLLLCLPVMGQVRQISSAPTTTFQAGTASGTYRPSLVYAKFVSAAGVGNATGTSDSALWTLTPIPAGTLAANGDSIDLSLHVRTAANANAKRLGVTVGGTQLNTTNFTASGAVVHFVVTVTRVDATHVNVMAFANIKDIGPAVATGGVNLAVADLTANATALVITGTSPTTGAANDVLLYSGIAELK